MIRNIAIGILLTISLVTSLPADNPPGGKLPAEVLSVVIDDDLGVPEAKLLGELGDRRLHHRSHVNAILFSPDGRRLASTGVNDDSMVRVWSMDSGEQIQQLQPTTDEWGWYDAIAFTPDGQQLLGGNTRGGLDIWEVLSGRNIFSEKRHERSIKAVVMSPDGRLFATAGEDGWLRVSTMDEPEEFVWAKELAPNAQQGGGRAMAAGDSGVANLAFTPDQKYLVVDTKSRGRILLFQVEDGELAREISIPLSRGTGNGIGSGRISLLLMPDGQRFITGGSRSMRRADVPSELIGYFSSVSIPEAKMWDFKTGELIRDLTKDRWEMGHGLSALSADGKRLAQAHFDKLDILSAETGESLRTISLPGYPGRSLCFSPDGKLIATGNGHTIAIFNVETGRRLFTDKPWTGSVIAAVAHSNGFELNDEDQQFFQRYGTVGERMTEDALKLAQPMVITAGGDGRIHLWNAATQEHIREHWLGPHASIFAIAISQNGRRFVTCGQTQDSQGAPLGNIVIWHLDRNNHYSLPLHRRGRGVAISSDGTKIVASCSNGSIGDTRLELWEFDRSYQRIAEFPRDPRQGLSQPITMRFSPDGRFVLIADRNGGITQWDTSPAAEDAHFTADWREHVQLEQPEREPWIGDAANSLDGAQLVTTTKDALFIWDMKTQKLQTKITIPAMKQGMLIRLSPDGSKLVASPRMAYPDPNQTEVLLFDLTTLQPILKLPLDDEHAYSLDFSPDSKSVVTGLTRGTALIWDVSR